MKFLKIILFLNLLYTTALAQQKPNILWITIEDTSPQFIGSYGNADARTPNIDKLAGEGVRFSNAFSTNSVCSPSRTTIITGVRTYEAGTGHHRSKIFLPDFMHGFPCYMRQAGYYTSNNSKTDYNLAGEKAFIEEAWNESSNTAGWHGRKPGQPFFAVFNFMDSHQSRTMTDPYDQYKKKVLDQLPETDRIGENDFKVPPFYRGSPEMRKQLARVYNALKLTDNKIGELLKRLDEDKLTDSTIIFFYADHGEGIPRGKTNGIDLSYRVPFVIWFPPMYKHLSPWGTSVVSDELISFEDLAPTMISIAGGIIPNYMKGRILSSKGRMEPAAYLELSSDRSDNGIDMIRNITDGRYLYARNYMPFMPEARFINYMEIGEIKKIMRRDLKENKLNELQKSLFEPRPAEYLFDTKNDSWETINLAGNPEYQALLKKMRSQLEKEILNSRDILFMPEYEMAQLTETPYEFRLEESKYPLKEILKAASLSGFRDDKTAEKQAALLKSTNSIVRYWALTGLRSQHNEVLQKYKKAILAALKDSYPPAAITAAAIAYDVFGNQDAESLLKKYIADKNKHLALLAMNYLLYVKNRQPFVNAVQTINASRKTDFNVKWACKDFLGSLGSISNAPAY